MFKKISLSVAAMVVLSACSACSTIPTTEVKPTAMDSGSSAAMMSAKAEAPVDKMVVMAAVGSSVVNFAFDSAALDKDAQEKLKAMAAKIKKENPAKVVVEGHCDERGTREYNLALGDRRAVSAKKYLVGLGVAPEKISTISYGKERPLDPAHNSTAWAKNRRAAVVFK